MAKFTTNTSRDYYGVLTVTEKEQSIPYNNTVVNYNLKMYSGDYDFAQHSVGYQVYINGEKVAYHDNSNNHKTLNKDSTITLCSGTATVPHNDEGKKTLSVSCKIWMETSYSYLPAKSLSASGTMDLTTIPRVSDLTLDVDTVLADGESQVIATATKKADAFDDILTVFLGDHNKQITSGEAFTIPMDWIEAIPTTSAVATVQVETFSGETSIGTKTVDLTVTVPDSVLPVINDLNISEAVAAVTKAFGNRYVQNLSQLNVSVDAEGVYGSTVKSYSVVLDGVTYIQQAFTSNVIKTAGTLEIKVKITDSRGRSVEDTFEVTVIEYVKPTITSMVYVHCDPDGSQNSNGDSTKVTIAGKVYPVEEQNTKALKLKYKTTADEVYTERVVSLSAWDFTVDVIINNTDPSMTYEYIAELTDKINVDSPETFRVTTGIVVISRKAGGTGVTLFGEAEEDGFVVKDKPTKLNDLTINGIMNILADGGYINVAEFIAQLGIDSVNADYPDYTNNWRWVKYKDGTFKAEYKETITTDTLTATAAVSGIKTYTHQVDLPFTTVKRDVPKWDVLQATGSIFTTNREDESTDTLYVLLSRAITSTSAYTATLGCTVTGLWK